MSAPLVARVPSIDAKFLVIPIRTKIQANDFITNFEEKMSKTLSKLFPGKVIDKAPLDGFWTELTLAQKQGTSRLNVSLSDDAPAGLTPTKAGSDYAEAVDAIRTRAVQWLINMAEAPAPSDAAKLIALANNGKADAPAAKAPAQVPVPSKTAAKTSTIWRICAALFLFTASVALGCFAFRRYVRPGL